MMVLPATVLLLRNCCSNSYRDSVH